MVSNLQWLSDRVGPDTRELLGPVAPPAMQVLRRSADVLNHTDDAVAGAGLATAVDEYRATALQHYDQNIAAILTEPDDDIAVDMGRALLTRRAMSATIGLTGRIIASAAAADSRPMWARLLGRQLPETMITDRVHSKRAAVASLGGYMSTRSITVLNSLRTGFALALAVLVTELLPVQNGPWIVLGALSVMRSSVLSTGTTAVRALTGTAIGIAVGALVMILLGLTSRCCGHCCRWSRSGPPTSAVGSFTASQAMFTMMVLIVFNLMHPTGWQVGLVRIEDILIGALVGLVVTALLWPGGAQDRSAAGTAGDPDHQFPVSRGGDAAGHRGASETIDVAIVDLSDETLIASRTYADAVRVYLSENGGAIDSEMLDTNNRIPRLRFAADLIADIVPPPTDAFPLARMVLEAHTIAVCARLEEPRGSSGGGDRLADRR